MATQDLQEPGILHDKLKDQIAISIKESLDKATSVLSSLHRVHSYLDVLKTMPPFRAGTGGDGLKNALEQVQSIRLDAATLLQTIYLTEIGLQSLQDFDKQGSSAVTVVPMLGESINSSRLESPVINSNEEDTARSGVAAGDIPPGSEEDEGEEGDEMEHQSTEEEEEEEALPPAKKINVGVVIANCSSCNRKFATDQVNGKCKNCRSGNIVPLSSSSSNLIPAAILKPTDVSPYVASPPPQLPFSSTPHHKHSRKSNRPRKLSQPPVSCKMCGVSFIYRRCLFRHLRENHPGLDVGNIGEYIQTVKVENNEDDSVLSPQNTSLNVTVGSDARPSDLEDCGGNHSTEEEGEAREEKGPMEVVEKLPFTKEDIEGGRVYTCITCNKMFDRPYRLQRHMLIHDPNRPRVNCQLCDRSFTRADSLENHIKCMHSGNRPYTCHYPMCQKSFPTQSSLISHLKVHTNGKPYKCLECEESFTLLYEYKQHVRDMHADTEDLRCPECYKVFPDVDHLEKHRNIEHRLECEICGKTFTRLTNLQQHVRIHSGDKVYNCKFCPEGFDSEYAYKQHMKSHPENQRSKKGFHCQLCDESFKEPSSLISHYRSQSHRDKATSLGIGADTTILNTIEGDLSDMNALVDEVAMGTSPVAMGTSPVAMRTSAEAEDLIPSFQEQSEDDSLSNSTVHRSQEQLQKMADQTL